MRPETPLLTVDIVIALDGGVVLVRRRFEPVGWALPGGFVDVGETVEHAAVREAQEETSLEVRLDALLYVYSDPSRDTRGHTVSAVFTGHAQGTPLGADDAAEARVFQLDALPSPIVFDHQRILADYSRWLEGGGLPRPEQG
ncbi:MAG: NUDIX hydrolase [Myxococcota bacterium]|jgi:8-oxo-dGTP diphosphatase|nr:NUDIX hydrolase [Myxococcota bacterium]